MRYRVIPLLCVSLIVLGIAPATNARPSATEANEELLPDLSNVRGLNYLGSWASNPVSMWRFYDSAQVATELGYLESIGCNAIRVWTSYAVWQVEGQEYLDKVANLLNLASERGITVMLIVWDSVGGKEPSSVPYDDLAGWVQSPGNSKASNPAFLSSGDDYVTDLAGVVTSSSCNVIWDVMNEPDAIPIWFLTHYIGLIKGLDSHHPVTVGYLFPWAAQDTAELVDILSYHPYGQFRESVEKLTQILRDISESHGNKPILATELGYPGGGGQRYEDVLDFITDQGVGFMLFATMISEDPTFPWQKTTGLFFKDGTVRDLEAVRAFQSVSLSQGIAQASFPSVKSPSDPGWIPYESIPYGFGAPELTELLLNWSQHYGVDYPEIQNDYEFYDHVFGWLFASLGLAGVLTESQYSQGSMLYAKMKAAVELGPTPNWPGAQSALQGAASLAASIMIAADVGEASNRPPEILHTKVSPNPFPGNGTLTFEMAVWDPDGIEDIVGTEAYLFSAGVLLAALPLSHQGSGIYSIALPNVPSLGAGQSFVLIFGVADNDLAFDYAEPIVVSGR